MEKRESFDEWSLIVPFIIEIEHCRVEYGVLPRFYLHLVFQNKFITHHDGLAIVQDHDEFLVTSFEGILEEILLIFRLVLYSNTFHF